MGISILDGKFYDTRYGAVLVCNTTDRAFGPLFNDAAEAQAFLDWCDKNGQDDPRKSSYDELDDLINEYRKIYGDPQ